MKFITIGSDPEFFVLDPKGKPYPATLFAKGTKDAPSPILGEEGFFEQRDNVSFEGNIPPCYTREEFITNMTKLRQYFIDKVNKFSYSLSNNGVEYFDKRYLNTPEAKEFGCSSVISSWDSCSGKIIERPTPVLEDVKFRVSGFHLHCGYDEPVLKKMDTDILIGRLFDLFLTLPSHVIKPEPERIETYGKWGMIRSKSYGVECRTLSSFFTQEKWLGWVWDQIMKIEEFINASNKSDLALIIKTSQFLGYDYDRVRMVFNSIFQGFKDKKVIELFNETKEVYEEKYKAPAYSNRWTNYTDWDYKSYKSTGS
jgi:hypothetical protein